MSGFADHFSPIAGAYRDARPRYPTALAAWLAAQAPERALAWEAGCGSGQFSAALAEHFARVHATDASAAQLAQAPPHPRIAYRAERAESCSLPEACADLICAAQAAHWFALPAFYMQARRVARPGALLALICYGRAKITPELDAIVRDYHDGAAGPYWPRARAQVESGYQDLEFPFADLAVPGFELEERWNPSQFLAYAGTWSATQRQIASEGPRAFAEFGARLAAAWGTDSPRRVRWPLGLRAARLD